MDGTTGSLPPVVGVLLGPAGVWGGEGHVLRGGRGCNLTQAVNQDRTGAPGSDIKAKNIFRSHFSRFLGAIETMARAGQCIRGEPARNTGSFAPRARRGQELPSVRAARGATRLGFFLWTESCDADFRIGSEHFAQGIADLPNGGIRPYGIDNVGHGVGGRYGSCRLLSCRLLRRPLEFSQPPP